MSTRSKLLKFFLPILILLLGGVGMMALVKSRPEPRKVVETDKGALVRTLDLVRESRPVMVYSTGTVEASQQAEIAPQVSGLVSEMAPGLVAGGFFRKGELLFRIEAVDFELAVERARAAVTRAEYDVAREESNARVARQEWDRLQLADGEEANPLVFHDPQLKNAKADLAGARAALRQAELDLERTRVTAPFDCVVFAKTIDLGQYVRAGTSVATVGGTATAEIIVPLPLEEAAWLDIPRRGAKEAGSKAEVRRQLGGREYTWSGKVIRSLGAIDPASRMARVVVAIDDPYNLRGRRPAHQPELAVGMFVEVRLEGAPLADIVAVPRLALRENDTVWLMDEDNRLHMRQVQVLRIERDEALVREGLDEGDRLVLTNLSGAAEGMKLRPLEAESS
jgi:RND family efflux transporter MFP subunit